MIIRTELGKITGIFLQPRCSLLQSTVVPRNFTKCNVNPAPFNIFSSWSWAQLKTNYSSNVIYIGSNDGEMIDQSSPTHDILPLLNIVAVLKIFM